MEVKAMENCSSGYQPSSIVETFHDIPHVDIDLGEINSTFEQTVEEYFEAIIVWSCLPVLFGIILIILFFLFWGLLWAYEYCTRGDSHPTYREPSTCTKVLLVISLLFLILVGIGFCGGAIYVEVVLNEDINEIGDVASSAEDTIDAIGSLANSYNHDGVTAELDNLTTILVDTGKVPLVNSLRAAAFPLRYLYGNISEMTQGYFLDDSADDVKNFELPRFITVIIFLGLVVVLFVAMFFILLFRSTFFITSVAVVVFIFMLLMWCASGAALGALIVASDVCFNPDETIITQISSSQYREITEYYMFCREDCNAENPLIENIEKLQMAQTTVDEMYDQLYEGTRGVNETIKPSVDASLERLIILLDNSTVDSLGELRNCSALSEEYSKTRDEFCDEGVIYSLVLFCVASGLGILYFVILCLTKKYVNLLYASERWGKDGYGFQLSPTPDIQTNGYASNGTNDPQRQLSVKRKQQYDGGWVAGKTHQGNYKHRASSSDFEMQGQLPEYSDVLNH